MNKDLAIRIIDSDLFDSKNEIKLDTVNKCIELFKKNNELDEKAVKAVFNAFPNNNNVEEVLAKVIILNNRYSAGLTDRVKSKKNVDVNCMASKIVDLYTKNVKFRNCQSKDDAVDTISEMSIFDFGEENRYSAISFASKYCAWTWHGEEFEPPIFDSYVAGMLYYINMIKSFTESFSQKKLKNDYGYFCKVYACFVNTFLKNTQFSNKQIDEFLWQYAKYNGNEKRESPIQI